MSAVASLVTTDRCSNVSMCLRISTNCFPFPGIVPLLYSVGNETYYYYYNIIPHYSPKRRIPGGTHHFILTGFVMGRLKTLMYFQWRYINVQRTGTPLFKINRHCCCNVIRWYIMSLYIDLQFSTLHDKGIWHFFVKNTLSVLFIVALGWVFKIGKVWKMRCQYAVPWIKMWQCSHVIRHYICLWVIFML